jgi:uncharacterized protein YdeI (YjbR/CyaY-like superfamily)
MVNDELPIIAFASAEDFSVWLDTEHVSSEGIWLKLAKKESGIASVTYAHALDVALCYGWIDGQKKPFDDAYWLQRFTPRRTRSKWSKINTEKVAALVAAGRMRPAGLQEIEAAKADGRWDAAYSAQSTATVPPELQAALDADPVAAAAFATLNSTNRYAFIYRVTEAKRPETRARRVAQFIEMLHDGRRLH